LTNPSPRAAAALFGRALARLDQIQPTALREPIRNMLRAGIELCTISPSLLGRPINHLVDLALVLTTEPEQGPHP
jgi:hypothetical protein